MTKHQQHHERDRADDVRQEPRRHATPRNLRGRANAGGDLTTRSGAPGHQPDRPQPDRSLVHLSRIDDFTNPL